MFQLNKKMGKIIVKVPLVMYSEEEDSPYRNMWEANSSKIQGIENLSGQRGEEYWADPYKVYDTAHIGQTELNYAKELGLRGDYSSDAEFYHDLELKSKGFTGKEVKISITYKDGYYYIECTTELDLKSIAWKSEDEKNMMTLEDSIFNRICGCCSDGVGENELGQVRYENQVYTVRMDWENIEKLDNKIE